VSAQPEDAPRGFVPMRDYLRLQRRLDEVEEELAYLKSNAREDFDEESLALLRSRLRLPRSCVLILREICLAGEAGAIPGRIHRDIGSSGDPKVIDVQICRLNKTLAEQGAPRVVAYRMIHGRRVLSQDGRAWLQKRAPELFIKGGKR
jgi:hypothetical protein